MRAGKRCTMEEMKSTAMILDSALKTSKTAGRQLKNQIKFLMQFVK